MVRVVRGECVKCGGVSRKCVICEGESGVG